MTITAKSDPQAKFNFDDEEVQLDIKRLIASIAEKYEDRTCVMLHADEIAGECWKKLAAVVDRGLHRSLPRQPNPTRAEWFAFFKTVLNNHAFGCVTRHRGTAKRTGNSKTDDGTFGAKPVEISIDDPDGHLQVSDPEDTGYTSFSNELYDDLSPRLSALEQLVLN